MKGQLLALGLLGSVTLATLQMVSAQTHNPLPPINKGAEISRFQNEHPGAGFHLDGGQISRVYGRAFSEGLSPQESAARFIQEHAGIWGVPASDLAPVGPFDDARHLQPIMYDQQTGQYKFTGVYYSHVRNGVPVFRSGLTLLVRNEQGYPLVLASSTLRDIGTFDATLASKNLGSTAAATNSVRQVVGNAAQINQPRTVIWAGVDNVFSPPVLALEYTTLHDDPVTGTFQAWQFVVDASNANILHQESLVYDVDVQGNVSGMATDGIGADTCHPEVAMAMPYARVGIGSTFAFADVNGNFTIPNAGSSPVTVTAEVRGQWFRVQNTTTPGGGNAILNQNVTPPGPANFLFNSANNSEYQRAEVNAYIHANKVRDHVLAHNPSYPAIATEQAFPVNVNIAQNCNAFYSPVNQSINFYVAGSGCTNTANSTVVHHEYGHRLVDAAGSGQGAYGEGMSDCIAVLVTDQPCLGSGFNGPCGSCLRNANNNCQYVAGSCSSCGSAIHTCGTILSGCVWKLRNNLQATHPATYRQILSTLTINSILLHGSTSSITPAITVDFLTLDDNDSDISNGTPHYTQINNAFSAHNMPGPPLAAVLISYPNGRPEFVSPAGGTTMRVHVNAGSSTPVAGSARLHVNTGSGFVQMNMNQISTNVYDAVFPPAPCGTLVRYYVSAQSTGGQTINSPGTAPSTTFEAFSAMGATDVFTDNFNSHQGWTISSGGAITAGGWERAQPRTDCVRGNPTADADASGWAYLTQNSNGPSGDICNSDIDGGSTTLTSPIMDASSSASVLSYWRWYDNLNAGNTNQDDPFTVQFSTNGGSSWQNLEVVGPTGPGTDGGWVFRQFTLSTVPGFTPTSQFRLRFTAQDVNVASVVEAAVDGVRIRSLTCSNPCPADINGSTTVDVNDLLAVINAWGPCAAPCPPDIAPPGGNGAVDVNDLLLVINSWGSCP